MVETSETVFAEYLLRWERGEVRDIEELCGAHPEIADRLRMLDRRWRKIASAFGRSGTSLPTEPPQSGPASTVDSRGEAGDGADDPLVGELLERFYRTGGDGHRYESQGEIARGGMGLIYRVWDPQLRRPLAMKVLRHGEARRSGASSALRARALARFLEEAQITGQLDHPGVVPVHEAGLDAEGRAFFTMRLVRGRDLDAVFDSVERGEEGWTTTRAVDVILKVCEAMAFAHSRGVIHRDLKPSNIMVGQYGETYVMDWGLARIVDEAREGLPASEPAEPATSEPAVASDRREGSDRDTSSVLYTREGDVLGTPAYMAPEQARGELSAMGPRSDIYSVGAILYRLLAGRVPHGGEDPLEVLRSVQTAEPRPLHEVRAGVPVELASICEKAMARRPEDRYGHMLEMAEDLRAYLEGRVVRAYKTGALAEFGKWVRRNRGFAASLAAAIVLAFSGLLGVSYVEAQGRRRAEQVTRLSDIEHLRRLTSEAEELWPCRPARESDLSGWLDRATRLTAKLDEHRATLAGIRARGTPVEESGGEVAWEFDDTTDQWWHDTLAQLVASLETFVADRPYDNTVADVQKRLEVATSIERQTLVEAGPAWERTIEEIADTAASPQYDGLVVTPQIGLVPLGRDPQSRLFEFAHVESGAIPEREPDGRLAITAESGIVLVLLPGGTFQMGAQRPDEGQPAGDNRDPWSVEENEGPVHQVALGPFFLSKYEMTQGQWSRLAGVNPSYYTAGRRSPSTPITLRNPVELVSWGDAVELLERFELILPTEAQWEYAARGGTTSVWWTGNDPAKLADAANVSDQSLRALGVPDTWVLEDWNDGHALPAPVGSYRANPFGLHDVHGNVWEWCRDWFLPYTQPCRAGDGLREGVDEAGHRTLRGGAYAQQAIETRSAYRGYDFDGMREDFQGVRPARALAR